MSNLVTHMWFLGFPVCGQRDTKKLKIEDDWKLVTCKKCRKVAGRD